jgi:hypothetical protein
MIRIYICIGFFLTISFNAFSYFDNEDFFSFNRETQGIKKITEYSKIIVRVITFPKRVKIVSSFDEKGFLLRKTHYYKNKIQVDYDYEYSISDTLLVIRGKYQYPNDKTEGYIVYKYYYNSLKQCYRFEVFFSPNLSAPAVFGDNFTYKNNQIQSYEWHNNYYTTIYKYFYANNGAQQIKKSYSVSGDSICVDNDWSNISIYENGKLTNFIRDGGVFGEPCWDETLMKVHIRFSNFDKQGNWTRSYYLTEKGKVFRSKREIEYW